MSRGFIEFYDRSRGLPKCLPNLDYVTWNDYNDFISINSFEPIEHFREILVVTRGYHDAITL